MLGIIGAMDSEVQELKNEMPDAKITSVAGMDFYEGHIHDKDVVVVFYILKCAYFLHSLSLLAGYFKYLCFHVVALKII